MCGGCSPAWIWLRHTNWPMLRDYPFYQCHRFPACSTHAKDPKPSKAMCDSSHPSARSDSSAKKNHLGCQGWRMSKFRRGHVEYDPYPNVYVCYLLLATIFFCEIATVGGKLEVYPISRHTHLHHVKSAFLADSWRRSTTAMIWCGTTWGSWPNVASHRGHRPAGIQEPLAEAPCTSQFSFKTCLMSR